MSEKTIEIDCPPGSPRPDDLIGGVIEGLGLKLKDPVLKFFGNFTWDYSEVPAEQWRKIQPVLKERITTLYNSGVIRYGSWCTALVAASIFLCAGTAMAQDKADYEAAKAMQSPEMRSFVQNRDICRMEWPDEYSPAFQACMADRPDYHEHMQPGFGLIAPKTTINITVNKGR